MEALEGEVIGEEKAKNSFPTLDQVNKNAFKKLNELILKADEETLPVLLESLAKLNASIRNNQYAVSTESEEEKLAREKSALVGDLLKKGR